MESPPPAVFHDKYERTQQGNLLGMQESIKELCWVFFNSTLKMRRATVGSTSNAMMVVVTSTICTGQKRQTNNYKLHSKKRNSYALDDDNVF